MDLDRSPRESLQVLQQLPSPGHVQYRSFSPQRPNDAVMLGVLCDKEGTPKDVAQAHNARPDTTLLTINSDGNETVCEILVSSHTGLYQAQVTSDERNQTTSKSKTSKDGHFMITSRKIAKADRKLEKTKRSRKTEDRAEIHSSTTTQIQLHNTKEGGETKLLQGKTSKISHDMLNVEHNSDKIGPADWGLSLFKWPVPGLIHKTKKPRRMVSVTENILPFMLAVSAGVILKFFSMEELPPRIIGILMHRHENLLRTIKGGHRAYSKIQDDPDESMKREVCVHGQLARNGWDYLYNKPTPPQTFNSGGEYGVTADDYCIAARTPCMHVRKLSTGYALCLVPLPAAERKSKSWKELGFWVL